ncbi:MAG: hypothetical protein ACKO7B_21890 [Flavobacteriales bacterium]
MRTILFILSACIFCSTAHGQARKADRAANRGNYFFLNGVISDYDIANGKEQVAPFTQVVVYQNNELYVSFFAGEEGAYSFFLPLGYEYEVQYGGAAFVNKKLAIDATQIDEGMTPRNVKLNVSLFRPVNGADFSMLNEPFERLSYDPEIDAVSLDEEYSKKHKAELERSLKKAKKLLQASDALAEGMN